MNNALKGLFLLILGLTGIQQSANAANPARYSKFYVFGDSLSDTGNDLIYTAAQFKQLGLPSDFPAIPPSVTPHMTYSQGRFSNGPMAFEYLWQALHPGAPLQPSEGVSNLPGESAVSFAYGGSGSGTSNKTPGGFFVPGALGQVNSFLQAFGNTVPKMRIKS